LSTLPQEPPEHKKAKPWTSREAMEYLQADDAQAAQMQAKENRAGSFSSATEADLGAASRPATHGDGSPRVTLSCCCLS